MTAASPALTAPARAGDRAAALRRGAVVLHPRRNGLNLIRLVLAYAVLVAHGWYVAGDGIGPTLVGENLGGWAVFGFFAISGYLITGSRLAKRFPEYLAHRVARIYPAFVVCLVVTAFVVAPVAFRITTGSFDGFLTTPTTPVDHVVGSLWLRIGPYDVAGTPADVPYAAVWNGSLWSLYYEFLCYLMIAALVGIGLVRRSPLPLVLVWAGSVVWHASTDELVELAQADPRVGTVLHLASQVGGDLTVLAKLVPFFLAGALLYRLRDRLVLTWQGAVAALIVSALLVWWLGPVGPQVASPLLGYALLWAGAVMPSPEVIRRNDISYGIYIYAFPVQQLLAMAGAHTWDLAVFDVVAAIATVPLATASWLLVERPAMRAVRGATSRRAARRAPGLAEQEQPLLAEQGPQDLTGQGPVATDGDQRVTAPS